MQMLLVAKCAANLHNRCSVVGNDVVRNCSHSVKYLFAPAVYTLLVNGAIPLQK